MQIIYTKQLHEILVDDDDYERLSRHKWYLHPKGYAQAWIGGHMVLMHRIVMTPGDRQVDHKDGNKLNNTKSNLRLVTQGVNTQNVPPKKNNTSGYVGVNRNGNYWQASVYKNGARVFCRTFGDKESAARAYNEAARQHYGINAYQNPC